MSFNASLGVRYTSTLVRDSIGTPFDVRPALAPALAFTAATPLERAWAPAVTLDFSTSSLTRHDADGTSVGLGRVSTVALTVGLTHSLPGGFTTTVAVGGLKYVPSEQTGIFRSGSGSLAALGALTLDYPLRLGPHHHLALEVRYDLHGFTTPALEDEGFRGSRAVHRVALTARASFGAPR